MARLSAMDLHLSQDAGTTVQRTSARRALLVVNRHARRGASDIHEICDFLADHGVSCRIETVREGETVSDLIRAYRGQCDLVIVGGGDGTLNAAIDGLMETGLPLGVLPLGTANDFARTLGITPDPLEAARVIAAGHVGTIDLGEVNGHFFLNVASIGFSAELARELTEHAKRRWGVLGYGIVAARLLFRSRLFTAWIEHDGVVEKVHTFQVAVGNGKHYGGGMTVSETAAPDDGRLDFYSLEVDHWWRLLALLPSLRRGTQGEWDDVRAFRTTELTIRTRRPRPVNTDGELRTMTPATFRVRPRAIRVLRPMTTPTG